MLNQPVKTPLTNNPNISVTKVFATIGITLSALIIILAIYWITLGGRNASINVDDSLDKVSTASAKPATSATAPTKDETADWKTFTNDTLKYSIKYPPNWLIDDYKDGPTCKDIPEHVFLSPTKDLLGVCQSDSPNIVSVFVSPSGQTIDGYLNGTPQSELEDITADKRTVKHSTITEHNTQIQAPGKSKVIEYLVDLGDKTMIVNYSQDITATDYSAIFEKIFSTLKFL